MSATSREPDLIAALEHNLGRRLRPEAPLSYNDNIDEGRDMFMDEGQIEAAENRYERNLPGWGDGR